MFSSPYLDKQTKLYFETYSSFRYMMILYFAPNFQKMDFCTTENFWGKILIFENTLITIERQEIQTIYLKKNISAYISFDIIEYVEYGLYYMKPCFRSWIRHKNMARLFKEKIAICMACCSKLGQCFFKLSLQNTHGQLMALWPIPNLLA